MDKIFFDDDKTYHILHITQSDYSIKITEYGRYNKNFERVTISMTLPTRKNILKYILDSFHTIYSAIDGDLFITGNDKHYIFNSIKRCLFIKSLKVMLDQCQYDNIYKSNDESLHVLHDPNELILLKEPNKNCTCHVLREIQNKGVICQFRIKKRIKHFTSEYQVMGTIEFKSDTFINFNNTTEQNIKACVKFHEEFNFENLQNKSCIYNLLQKLYKEYYYDITH